MTIPESFALPPIPPADPPAPVQSGPWFYAQLADGVCTSVTEAAGPLEGEHLVRLDALDASLLGQVWDGEEWSAPAAVNPTEWLIDVGPFFDRFGAAKMPVLLSASPVVQAVLRDVQVRKWIDLQRADVATALGAIRGAVPALTEELAEAILTTPVSPEENLALRVQFFGGVA